MNIKFFLLKCSKALAFASLMFCATFAYAQQGTVKGKVVDDDGVPIAGASVMQKGTTNGGYTDVDGNYEISVNNMKSGVLQFTFVGFNTVEETVNGRSTIDVKMNQSVINLGEAVAVGYGTQT